MRYFTGKDYLKIDIANQFGLDKEIWDKRIDWVNKHENDLENFRNQSDEPYLFSKAVRAYRDAQKGIPTGHIMWLDATNSGLQIMAILSGCLNTAKLTNLINTGKRESAYMTVAERMKCIDMNNTTEIKAVKYALMTHYYCKKSQEDTFIEAELGEEQEKAFYLELEKEFEGPEMLKNDIQDEWNPKALFHSWPLPDGHIVKKPVLVKESITVTNDAFDVRFVYRHTLNKPSKKSTSLVPDVIHSIDGWVVREMCRRCKAASIPLVPVHDAFGSSPIFMNQIRQFYLDTLIKMANSNIMDKIWVSLGYHGNYEKISDNLPKLMKDAEYALC